MGKKINSILTVLPLSIGACGVDNENNNFFGKDDVISQTSDSLSCLFCNLDDLQEEISINNVGKYKFKGNVFKLDKSEIETNKFEDISIYDFDFYELSQGDGLGSIASNFGYSYTDKDFVKRFLTINGLIIDSGGHLKFKDSNRFIRPGDVVFFKKDFDGYIGDIINEDFDIDFYNKYYSMEKGIYLDQEKVEGLISSMNATISYMKNENNKIYVKDDLYVEKLKYKLEHELDNIKTIYDLYEIRKYILSICNDLNKYIDYDMVSDMNIVDLFDYMATLYRLDISRQYFSSLTGDEFLQLVNERGLGNIIDGLKIKRIHNFTEYSNENYENYRNYISNFFEEKSGIFPENLDLSEVKDLFYGLIYLESKYHIYNKSHTGVIGIAQTTKYIYMGKDSVDSKDKYDYIFDETTNPFNPEENIERGIQYIAFLYRKFANYSNGEFDIHDIVFTAYNRGQGNISRLLKKYGTNWRNYINNKEGENYYSKVIGSKNKLTSKT
ncbi:lytic transglycosylase domain-containing protein [Candidatus Vampirococcus lugosii]|uniref:Transglycosylase SLT domain-containing protein n=1 Tax=Candidatus Vampirococcus lugosii TaxID=2789015 RepID=A0ABS5QM01_9BACT|nr:lytic transglycosylase domain-containing protein [Candidatus Vampirococcus lugosii]MBS8121504.1 hypothetical protein [Candidatus Vampirococcus lugosii]